MLDGNRPEDLPFRPHLHAFLGLDRGLDAVGPPPVLGHAPGELVDQLDAPAADDVVAVAVKQRAGVEGDVDHREQRLLGGLVQRLASQEALDVPEPRVGQRDVAGVLVDDEIGDRLELRHRRGHHLVRHGR